MSNSQKKAFDITREFVKNLIVLDLNTDNYSDYLDEKTDIQELLSAVANIGYHQHMGQQWIIDTQSAVVIAEYNNRLKEIENKRKI